MMQEQVPIRVWQWVLLLFWCGGLTGYLAARAAAEVGWWLSQGVTLGGCP